MYGHFKLFLCVETVYNKLNSRTAAAVYDHVAEHKHFAALHSTRHLGPLVFHLCLTHQLDEFLVQAILYERDTARAANAIRLFLKVHPGSTT